MSLVRRYLPLVAAGLLVGAGLGLLIILGFGVGSDLIARLVRARSAGEPALVPEVSSPAPAFDLQTPQGTKVSLSDQRGRPVLVNFWATWCGPCLLEMPLIQKYQDRYPDKFRVLAVNDDEASADVQAYIAKLGLSFTVLLDPGGKVTDLYRVRAFPSSYFIDSDGVIRFVHLGTLNEDQLSGYLQKLGVGS